jgi:hypothetical protein
MIKLIANPDKLPQLETDERTIIAIQLMRMLKAIRYNNIIQAKIVSESDDETAFHLHMLYNHAASLYEGIKTLVGLYRHFKDLDYFKTHLAVFKRLSTEFGNGESFTNKVLKPIRNELTFHYDETVVKKELSDFMDFCTEAKKDIVLVSGKTKLISDTKYEIADNVAANYALNLYGGKEIPIDEKIRRFGEGLLELSNLFCSAVEMLIPEMLTDYGMVVET